MKKTTLHFSAFLFALLLFINNMAYANIKKENNSEFSYGSWFSKAFAPDLYLQPYFDMSSFFFEEDATCVNSIPFWEGFNSTSTSFACWTRINGNDPKINSLWQQYQYNFFEGDRSIDRYNFH